MCRVTYAPAAEGDLVSIAEHIARDKPEAARRWLIRVQEAFLTLATQPEMGEARPEFGIPGCRSFSIGSYVIFFRKSSAGIEVARVIHGSRDMRNL